MEPSDEEKEFMKGKFNGKKLFSSGPYSECLQWDIDKTRFNLQADLAVMREGGVSPDEAIAFAEEYLRTPSTVWRKAGIATQTKLQWFQFPSGLIFDGEKFETKEVSNVFKAKELISAPMSSVVVFV